MHPSNDMEWRSKTRTEHRVGVGVSVHSGWHRWVPWMSMLALVLGFGTVVSGVDAGDRTVVASKPILLHNLPEAQIVKGGSFEAVSQHLAKAFELRSVLAPGAGDILRSTRLVWWVVPVAGGLTKEGALAQEALVPRIPGYVEGGGTFLLTLGGRGGDSGMEMAKAVLSRLGIVLGPKRTGAKKLRIPDRHPGIGGLVWTTGGLTPMDMEDSPVLRRPVIVSNDLAQKPGVPGAPDFAGIVMILGEWGRGRVVIVGDTDWVKKPAWETGADSDGWSDNRRILDGLVGWGTGEEPRAR